MARGPAIILIHRNLEYFEVFILEFFLIALNIIGRKMKKTQYFLNNLISQAVHHF